MLTQPLSKKIAVVVVMIAIIVTLWFVVKKPNTVSKTSDEAKKSQTSLDVSAQSATVVNSVPVDPAVAQVKNSGVSDASLAQDISVVDQQLKDFSTQARSASATVLKK